MTAAGYGDKPLAITGMNVAPDAPPPGTAPDAAPGTVGSALWLADSIGTAQELGIWTTVLWAISDDDPPSLGLLGTPPAHAPRPEYYANSLYADHYGPTLLDITSAPPGVSAHATRNEADDATEVIVVNWSSSAMPLAFEVQGLVQTPNVPIFELPPWSLVAVDVPDSGSASALVYGEAQHAKGIGPEALDQSAGTIGANDGGAGLPARVCAAQAPGPVITSNGTAIDHRLAFGSSAWGSFVFAGDGQPTPTLTLAPDGNGFAWQGELIAPLTNNYEGVGLFYNGPYCADASDYTGVQFDVSGDLGGCTLAVGSTSAADVSTIDDASRGQCTLGMSCYGPSSDVTSQLAGADAGGGAVTIRVPFASERGGSPVATLDPSTLTDIVWRLGGSVGGPDGGACAANLTIENVSLYK
jgi:hypothetical protein